MKGTIRLSLDPISTLVYVALLILTIYNIRLSWNLAKLKSSVAVKPFESLSSLELNEIEKSTMTEENGASSEIFFRALFGTCFCRNAQPIGIFLNVVHRLQYHCRKVQHPDVQRYQSGQT